jgi:5'-nucleotidase
VLELPAASRSLSLVNVNLHPNPTRLCWTRLSFRYYDGSVVPGQDPRGRKHFWITVHPVEQLEEGIDHRAVARGVSLLLLRRI